MQLTAISLSTVLHFPANRNLIHVPNSPLRTSIIPLWFQSSRIEPHNLINVENSGISFSADCKANQDQEEYPIDRNSRKSWIHFVGVGGCGLSALARLSLKQGFEVSGSDIVCSSFMDGLKDAGACLHIGHSASNIQRDNGSRLPDAIVVSSAIPGDNVEILYAKYVGVPVYKRDYWLGKLTKHHDLIAVSGSHGKSTTASMLAYILKAMGDDLTAVIGANVPQFQDGNIILGGGPNFVLEADEYDGCFLGLSPKIALVTNLDWEHVDIFQDKEAVINIFRMFLKQTRAGGHIILWGDSPDVYSLLDHTKQATESGMPMSIPNSEFFVDSYRVTTYGMSSCNDWHASSLSANSHGGIDYVLCQRGDPVACISLQLPGVHNVLNSLAVIATVIALFDDERKQVDELINSVRTHLKNFVGVSRRFEMIGEIYGCHIYDDYAHHPAEIRAVLQAARQRFPSKALWVVFQPHTYSRLAALKDDFSTAFVDANRVIVTEVYAAREKNVWGISGGDIASSVIGPPSEYVPLLEEVVDKLVLKISVDLHHEIVVLILGAGDVSTVGPRLLHKLQEVNSCHRHACPDCATPILSQDL